MENWGGGVFFRLRYAATRWKLTTKLQVDGSITSIPDGNML
jgi:hypothetical protein